MALAVDAWPLRARSARQPMAPPHVFATAYRPRIGPESAVQRDRHVSGQMGRAQKQHKGRLAHPVAPLSVTAVSRPEFTHQRAHFPNQRGGLPSPLDSLAGVAPMLPRVAVAERGAGRWAAVHPAPSPAAHRRGFARRPAPCLGAAPGRQEPGRMHGVDRRRWGHAPPPFSPLATAPTIACPPSFTVTCSTRTVCCPVRPLWRFNVSTIIVKVRVSLFP